MKKLLLRADDLGFSEAVNYGIARTVQKGLIQNCGIMVNMDATEHAVELFKDIPCCLGLHCNISVGRPITAPDKIPTLVDSDGIFYNSRQYRNAEKEFADVEDLKRELSAQYLRFVELFNRKPSYFEAHAVASENLAIALEQVAKEYDLFYQPSFQNFTLGETYVINTAMHSMEPGYDARIALKTELSKTEEGGCYLYVCHPGYVDAYLLKNTSLTLPRADEVDMLCDSQIYDWLKEQGFVLVTYNQLACGKMGSASQACIKEG